MLESALGRPENLFHYGTPTLPEMAAAYAFGIVRNHPFNDGNKRTGFLVAATFLEVNGLNFFATEESVVVSTLALAAQEWDEAAYARWLSENSAPRA
jgi:death-on-curing protein